MEDKRIFSYGKFHPEVDGTVFLAPGSKVVGRVRIGPRSSVWYNSVVRGDADRVEIGSDTNIQDNCTLHCDPGYPLKLGNRISVGHNSILHGCTLEDGVLVGMGAIILNGARVGAGAVIGAGALVTQGMEIPPGHMAMGIPARVVRALSEEEMKSFQAMALRYEERSGFIMGRCPSPDADR
ncbi:MAG: gamma carbonic anhydrase family protein [Bacillota bacterium]